MAEDSRSFEQTSSGNSKNFQNDAKDSEFYQGENITVNKNNYAPTRPPLGKPFQYQPLPSPYVDRPEIRAAVKAKLLNTQPTNPGTLVMSAIYGLGGIGKSVMASALVFDEEVQKSFSDGILWATLGQNPDLLPRLSDWIQALGDRDYQPTSLDAASMHLRTLLIERKMLLVVDDVWNPEHVIPFRVGGSGCRVLVTTRQARIPDAERFDMDVMTPEQSLELLLDKAQCSDPLDEERQIAKELAEELGNLPLALELAGAQIADGLLWEELLEDLRDEVARLETLDSPDLCDVTQEQMRKRLSLLASFNLSLKQLSTEQLNQFIGLGVLPEDVTVSQEMVSTLWQVTPRQAGAMLRGFWNKALILRGVEQSARRASYRMHDLMHDVARRLIEAPTEPTDEGEMPGWEMTVAQAHSQLLERYQQKTTDAQWHTLKDDGYIHAQLTWHMEQAQQPEAIHQLLKASNESGRNGWYEACEAIGKPTGFVNDVGRAWRLTKVNYKQAPDETLALLFRYALIRTSINSMASNVPATLVEALVKHGIWQPAQGLAYAQQAQNPWQRAECISVLVPHMPEALLPEILETISQIRDAAYRSYVMRKLAERFPEYWPNVLVAIRQIHDRYGQYRHQTQGFSHRAFALQQITQCLPSQYLPEAIAIAREIDDIHDRAMALITLVPSQPELLPEALEVSRNIQSESHRAYALIELSKQMPELLLEALEVSRNIQSESHRAYALIELSKQIPELLLEALEVSPKIQDEWHRAIVLRALLKQLPPELLGETLEVIRNIQSERNRAITLRKIPEQLPLEFLGAALEVSRNIQSESHRAYALIELSKQMPELLPEALKVSRNIQSRSHRAYALIELSKQMPELLPEVLEVTRNIQSESHRVIALVELSKQLPPELLGEALEVSRNIQDEWERADALIKLSKQMPELLGEALEVTHNIQSEGHRAYALIELSKQEAELWGKALEVSRNIQSEGHRAYALIELSKQLPPELLPEALEATRNIHDEWHQAIALRGLSKRMPQLLGEALEVTRNIQDEWERADALIKLSKQMPEFFGEALEVSRNIQDEGLRASALIELPEQLPPELLNEALEATRNLQDEGLWTDAQRELSKRIPELLGEALQVSRNIQSGGHRASALIELPEQLSPELLSDALEVTQNLQDEGLRAIALRELSKQIPELLPEALEVTQNLQDEGLRVIALIELSKQIPELLPEILEVTRNIQSEGHRARALIEMSKQLTPNLLREALEISHNIQDELYQAQALSGLSEYLTLDQLDIALSMAGSMQDKFFGAEALQGLLPRLHQLSLTFTQWSSLLETLAYQNRQDLLSALPDIRPITLSLGSEQAFSETLQAVREVCKQWP